MSFQIRISVRMTHRDTVLRMFRIFGGTFKDSRARDARRHKHSYEWYVGDLKTVDVLTKVEPYLTTKKKHALLLLEYRRACVASVAGGRCPPSLVKRRLRYFNKMTELNKRGPK